MAINKTAEKNHEELFLNHKSVLKEKDPELVEIFDNFAFDEVMQYGDMDVKTRLKVILASLIAQQSLNEYKVMMKGAMNVGVTPIEIKEIVYQAVPYCGMAKVFDFLHATNDILEEYGIPLPLEGQSTTTTETRLDKGLEVQKSIFGETIDRMYEEAPKDQIHIQHYLSDNCFGDFYTRTGLSIKERELITFVILISLGGCEPQVKGHIQGNFNVGNDKQTLLTTITQLIPFLGYPRTLNAIRCINEVTFE